MPAFSCILLACEHLPGSNAFFITVPPQVTDGEARAGGRVKAFGPSRNESLKKWFMILMKMNRNALAGEGSRICITRDLKGTTKAWHRTPRLVLEGNCCVQAPPERHRQGTQAPAMTAALQPSATHLWVSPGSSSSVWVSLDLPVRWVPKALTNSKQMLPKDSGWKSSSFPQAVFSTCKICYSLESKASVAYTW